MNYYNEALKIHEKLKGKYEIKSKVAIEDLNDLSVAYTPGVAAPCIEISKDISKAYKYTSKGNTIAVVTDGSAVLGLGNIGAEAALPVMEGKAILFKRFGGVDAIPICLRTQNTDEIISIIENIAPAFGGINLEDISAPRCFEIEDVLKDRLKIPVFHDDQHGTAIVTCAALINALKICGKKLSEVRIVINGAGAAGCAIMKMLFSLGVKDIAVCDRKGIISQSRSEKLSPEKLEIARLTNPLNRAGVLSDALHKADVFIGVSAPNVLRGEMVGTMNKDSILFPMANPEPEILPEIAFASGARIVGTGRSDFPNQINNVLAFPGVFKGALASNARRITEEMKKAAIFALANTVSDQELREDYIIPSVFKEGVAEAVAEAVAGAWSDYDY